MARPSTIETAPTVSRDAVLASLVAIIGSLGFVLLFSISSMLLHRFGLTYEYTGGNPLEKVHPGTWLASVALGIAIIRDGGLFAFADRVLREHLGIVFYLAAGALLLAYAVLGQRVPFTPLIDTFLLPAIIFLLFARLSDRTKRRLTLFLHAIFVVNAIIALFEYATGLRLTPYVAGTNVVTGDWRSTALFGHPLANACLAGVYVIALATGGDRQMRDGARLAAIALQMLAMVAFGGRVALVGTLAILVLVAGYHVLRVISGRRVAVNHVAALALGIPLIALALFAAAEAGFFDRLVARFISDDGSAQTRVAMFRLFDPLTLRDILFGPNPALIDTLKRIEGIELGIESFWVGFILAYGLLVSVPFFIGLACLCWEIARATRPGAILALLFFFGVASTSVSLSAKSPLLGIASAVLLILLERRRAARADP